jgi:hypothetical protein
MHTHIEMRYTERKIHQAGAKYFVESTEVFFVFTCLEGTKWKNIEKKKKTFLNTFSGFKETSKFAD